MDIIFILGASRSGTTLLNKILGGHAKINVFGELHYFGLNADANEVNKYSYPYKNAVPVVAKLIAKLTRKTWDEPQKEDFKKARELLNTIVEAKDPLTQFSLYRQVIKYYCEENTNYFVDQTGRNLLFIDSLQKYFPDAKYIQMIRDPRAVLYSQKKRWKKRWYSKENKSIPLKNSLRVLANYHPVSLNLLWNKYFNLGFPYKEKDNFKLLRYEDLVTHPESHIKQLCEFLDLPFQEDMLQVSQTGTSHGEIYKKESGISKRSLDLWSENLSRTEIFITDWLTKKGRNHINYPRGTDFSLLLIPGLLFWALYYPIQIIFSLTLNPKVLFLSLKRILFK